MIEIAGPRLEDAQRAEEDAHQERSDAYDFYWDSLYQLEEAEETFWESSYDPTLEYIDYLEWVKPEDYDAMLEYLEDCNEDANQTDCVADCEYEPSAYAWCEPLERCAEEVNCCKAECDVDANGDMDEDCEDACDLEGGRCRASVGTWYGADNFYCFTYSCYQEMTTYVAGYCVAETPEFDSCKENAVTSYYSCLGGISCEQHYVTVCQDMCMYTYGEYNADCYGACATDLTTCECTLNFETCYNGCEGDSDCERDCVFAYVC